MDTVQIVIEIAVPKSAVLSEAVLDAVEAATRSLLPYNPTYRVEEMQSV